MSTKITTGKVRFSFPHVFEPRAGMDGGTEKYSVCLLVPKTDTKTIAAVKLAVKAAYEKGVSIFGGKLPAVWKNPLRDGDAERPDSPEYEGMFFVNASTLRKPQIVDADLVELMDRNEFYAGCWGRASVNFYAFSVNGNKGVGAGLNNLQKLEDGERLGGGSTAADDFGTVTNDDLL
jgi:hypothetical protein